MGKNLLVNCHSYRSFQKDYIDNVAHVFDKVHVFVRLNKFAQLGSYLPISWFDLHSNSYKIDMHNKPKNVNVYPVPIMYLPTDKGYKKLGKKHLSKVNNLIEKHEIDFDLIHSHFTWSAGYVGAKLKEKWGVPFVVNARGYDIYSLPFKDEEWKSKITTVLQSADEIITTSESNLSCFEKLNINQPVNVIPNGFKSELFYPRNKSKCRSKLGIPQNKKVILAVGNLREIKGHEYLIEAMNMIKNNREDIICYIVGGGRIKGKLKELIKNHSLQDNVLLKGKRPHNEIPYWMNASDLFVMPSIKESFGTVQIEAMACETPLVATKNGGSETIITSKEYGLLVEPKNPKMLAKKILIGLKKDWDYDTIHDYAQNYSWDNISSKIIEIYENFLKGDLKTD